MKNIVKLEELREEKLTALDKHLTVLDKASEELAMHKSITETCIEQLSQTREEWQNAEQRFMQFSQNFYSAA